MKQIKLPDHVYERLEAAARERDLSHEDVLREAIELHALGDPKRRKLAMNLETIARQRRLLAEGH